MSDLYDVLETCLQEVENGVQVETVLERYPEIAEELRPLVQASLGARSMAASAPSSKVLQRNRTRLLQHAAKLREEERRSFRWLPSIRRWAVALVLLVLFLFSGTSLVRASSNALPGDSLYRVKRSWEGFTLALTFDSGAREVLQVEHENERLEELHELFASGRTAHVDFAGLVSRKSGEGWWIDNVLVILTDQTLLPVQPIQAGAAVRVYGTASSNGVVVAERVESLPAGAPLPEFEDEPEIELEGPQATPEPDHSGPGSGSGSDAPGDEEEKQLPSGNGNANDNSNEDHDNLNTGGTTNEDDNHDNTNDVPNENNSNDDQSGSGGGGNDDNGNESNTNGD